MTTETIVVKRYKGVNIEYVNGYYYPSVNRNAEFTSINATKRWIREVWCTIPEWVLEGFRFLGMM